MKSVTISRYKIFLLLSLTITIFSCNSNNKSNDLIRLFPVKSGEEYQYIDSEGKIIINPQFSEASVFHEGLALVKGTGENSLYGFITEDGKYTISPSYKSATIFSDGLAWVVTPNSAPQAINTKGEVQFTLQQAERVKIFHEGYAAFSVRDSSGLKWGFVDKSGVIKINPQFSAVGGFNENLCAVSNSEGKWGYIDKEGIIKINYQFDSASGFYSGVAVVVSNDKAGAISTDGLYKVNPQFDEMYHDKNGFLIRQNEKWGWCDSDGLITINPQFNKARPFGVNSIAPVLSGNSWGYIDKDGKIVINPQFDQAYPHNGDLALVKSSKQIGFIDPEGKYKINPQFQGLSQDLQVKIENGYTIYNSIETDFFDVNGIVTKLNLQKPEGFTFSSKLGDILDKYSLSQDKISQYSNEHQIITNKEMNKEVSFDFFIIGDFYVEVPDGWYTKRVIDRNISPTSYAYRINLSGKARNKIPEIIEGLVGQLSGYNRIMEDSAEDVSVYTKDNNEIKIYKYRGNIIVLINNIMDEEIQYYD